MEEVGEVRDAKVGGGRAVTGSGVEQEAQVGEDRDERVVPGEPLQAHEQPAMLAIVHRVDHGDGVSRGASRRQIFVRGISRGRRSCEAEHEEFCACADWQTRDRGRELRRRQDR